MFLEERNKFVSVKKFAIPNVRVGSIIEFTYSIDSPFIFNFRPWEFQSDIPKVQSEYWASLPGVYVYNVTLRGFLKLSKNESQLIKGCLGSGTDFRSGGFSADCSLMKLGMKDIPAFVEEDYMTARKNFLASVQFELSEVRHPDGRIDKVTKEWKDADQELRQDSRFGVQLKKGKDIGQEVEKVIAGENDDLMRARKVYDFIKGWYVWNDTYGKYSEFGIKKAFSERRGNVGDINLSLVAALRFAGLEADPVILSTRSNGAVVELHPVLSEFNYVVARVAVDDKVYLADATEKYYPFGLLPERCLNGKGRVMAERGSYWMDLTPADARKTTSALTLRLDESGVIRGTLHTTFGGYDAVSQREKLGAAQSQEAYVKDLKETLNGIEITGYHFENTGDFDMPLVRTLDIELRAFDGSETTHFLFNPFFLEKWLENPFKSRERLYPVDFGAPLERVSVFNLEFPEGFEVASLPASVALALPQAGGRFLFEAKNSDSRLTVTHLLSIRKTVYSSTEYHYLKELFNRILQVQNGELVFKKKT